MAKQTDGFYLLIVYEDIEPVVSERYSTRERCGDELIRLCKLDEYDRTKDGAYIIIIEKGNLQVDSLNGDEGERLDEVDEE